MAGKFCLDLGVELVVVCLSLGDLLIVLGELALGLRDLGFLLLLRDLEGRLLLLELLLERDDVVDGVCVGLGDLVDVVDDVDEILEITRTEEQVEDRAAAALIGAAHTVPEHDTAGGELRFGIRDGRVGLVDPVACLLEVAFRLLEALLDGSHLGAELLELSAGCIEVILRRYGVRWTHGSGKRCESEKECAGQSTYFVL